MNVCILFFAICASLLLVACGARTEEQPTAQIGTQATKDSVAESSEFFTPEQLDALRRSRRVAVVFSLTKGSGGNGEVMKELKAIDGLLSDPTLNYDVFEPDGKLDFKELKQGIEVSLDRGRRVLIDSGGTPELREKANQLLTEVVGGFTPDTAGTIIMRAPEDKGGGYLTIPLYSKADVQNQIAQGRIKNPEEQTNSIENFFFEPRKP